MLHTIHSNLEYAKRQLVINAITHLQNTISTCYGVGEFPSTNFSDEDVRELYYNANGVALKMYDELEQIEGEDNE